MHFIDNFLFLFFKHFDFLVELWDGFILILNIVHQHFDMFIWLVHWSLSFNDFLWTDVSLFLELNFKKRNFFFFCLCWRIYYFLQFIYLFLWFFNYLLIFSILDFKFFDLRRQFLFLARLTFFFKLKNFSIQFIILCFEDIQLKFKFIFMFYKSLNLTLNVDELVFEHLFKFSHLLVLLKLVLNFIWFLFDEFYLFSQVVYCCILFEHLALVM